MSSIKPSTLIEQVRSSLPWWRDFEKWISQQEISLKNRAVLHGSEKQQLRGALMIIEDARVRITALLPETADENADTADGGGMSSQPSSQRFAADTVKQPSGRYP